MTGRHTAAAKLPTVTVMVLVVALALAAAYLVGQSVGNNPTSVETPSMTNSVSGSGRHSLGDVGCSHTVEGVAGDYLVTNDRGRYLAAVPSLPAGSSPYIRRAESRETEEVAVAP